jgi:hypothetical protein
MYLALARCLRRGKAFGLAGEVLRRGSEVCLDNSEINREAVDLHLSLGEFHRALAACLAELRFMASPDDPAYLRAEAMIFDCLKRAGDECSEIWRWPEISS